MKLLGVAEEDPFHWQTWSGSSAYFFRALQDQDVLYDAVSAQPSRWAERMIQVKNFHPEMEKWKFKYHLDPALAEVRTKVAEAIAREAAGKFGGILQIGAWYDMTAVGVPAFSYHDGNLARRLDNPFGYPGVAQKYLDQALAHERKVYHKLEGIFTMSAWLADSFVNDFGVDRKRVVPVYAGINMPDVDELETPNFDSKNILFVGTQFERKGGPVLLRAFEKVRQQVPDATLTILGYELEDVPAGVITPGFISKRTEEGLARVKDLYRNSAVFALPTLYEPFGVSFVEAMAHGLPCIGTNHCAIPEIIQEGTSGLLVEPENADELAVALVELLTDEAKAKEYGEAGFSAYRDKFRWTRVAERVKEHVTA